MNQSPGNSKIYIEIVRQLRAMIEYDGLKPGDKIPSERELSERLLVGRSSVREALRALELLGLIETRRGEGTFIRDFRGNQLVQLLSTFILQDEKSRRDVMETKCLIELDCLRLASKREDRNALENLKKSAEDSVFTDEEFFGKIAELADNHLMLRIWQILKDYYRSFYHNETKFHKKNYLGLIDSLIKGDPFEIHEAYRSLRKLSE